MPDLVAPKSIDPRPARTCVIPMVGTPCRKPVPDDAPLPMCMEHLAAAWAYCNDKTAEASIDREAIAERYASNVKTIEKVREATDDPTIEDPASFVYYIRFGDRIKIGYTCQLGTRLANLPHDELLAIEPGGRGVEVRRHRQFAEHRIRGEWFAAAEPIVQFARELSRRDPIQDRLALLLSDSTRGRAAR